MFKKEKIKFIDDHYFFNWLSSEDESLFIINNSHKDIPKYLEKYTLSGKCIVKNFINNEEFNNLEADNLINFITDLKSKEYNCDNLKNSEFLNKIIKENPEKVNIIKNKLSRLKLFHVVIIPGNTSWNNELLSLIEKNSDNQKNLNFVFDNFKELKTIDLIDFIEKNKEKFINLLKKEVFYSDDSVKKFRKMNSFNFDRLKNNVVEKSDYMYSCKKESFSIYYTLFLATWFSKFKHHNCYILKKGLNVINHRFNFNIEFKNLPNCIIKNKIWIGNKKQAYNLEFLKFLKITHILNCTNEAENKFGNKFKYLHINVTDYEETNISTHFSKGFEFIKNCFNKKNKKLLIHCTKGKSRSATFLIMFLMKKFNENFEIVYDFCKENRPEIDINSGFVDQLKEFELNNYNFVN